MPLLLASSTLTALAQAPSSFPSPQSPAQFVGGVTLRPVPREGSRIAQRPVQSDPQHQGWDLQWRRSANVAAAPPIGQAAVGSPSSVVPASAASGSDGRLRIAGSAPTLRPVAQATWLAQPQRSDVVTPTNLRPRGPGSTADMFEDPFGDDSVSTSTPAATAVQDDLLFPPSSERAAEPALPSESRPLNELRSELDPRDEPLAAPAKPQQAMPAPQSLEPQSTPPAKPQSTPPAKPPTAPKVQEGPSLGDMLRESKPDDGLNPPQTEDTEMLLPAPSRNQEMERSEDGKFENPFQRDRDSDTMDRDRINSGPTTGDDGVGRYEDDEEDLRKPASVSCSELRRRVEELTIDKVSLDISPPYRPDEIDVERYEKLKADFDEKQSIRQWRNIDGRELATGRLRDLAYEKAVIQTENGSTEELQINRLSEADLAYISENWGLPKECLIEQVAYTPRAWATTTMTWKASNLCHNPLYFEDVNLERYGHTHGPVLEPVVQSAHFFANIAVLPYKMGVHSPHECQYALGYYRPGNCAPWIVPPVPLSARGALTQAAAMTGLFWLIP